MLSVNHFRRARCKDCGKEYKPQYKHLSLCPNCKSKNVVWMFEE